MLFTVLGMYKDSQEIWADVQEAPNVDLAVTYAVQEILKTYGWSEDRKKNLLILEVMDGEVQFELTNTHPIPASEFKGPRDWSPRKR